MVYFYLVPVLILETISYFEIRIIFEPRHDISTNVVCATSKASNQSAHTRSLNRDLPVA